MTADAKFQLIGGLHGGVESTPEYYARNKKHQGATDRRTPKDAAGEKTSFGFSLVHFELGVCGCILFWLESRGLDKNQNKTVIKKK
jgi:hypothetical protein